MPKKNSIALFIAATSALTISSAQDISLKAGENDLGGLKEWNTDQGVDEKSTLDQDAEALQKKAEEEDICVPIGEGENCW